MGDVKELAKLDAGAMAIWAAWIKNMTGRKVGSGLWLYVDKKLWRKLAKACIAASEADHG